MRVFPADHTARPPMVGPADGGDRSGIVAVPSAARITPRGVIFRERRPNPLVGDGLPRAVRDDRAVTSAACCSADERFFAHVRNDRSAITLTLQGDLDLAARAELRHVLEVALARAVAGNRQCVVDMAGVSYIDGAALRAVAVTAGHARDGGGRFVLVRPAPVVRRMLALSGYEVEVVDPRRTPIAHAMGEVAAARGESPRTG